MLPDAAPRFKAAAPALHPFGAAMRSAAKMMKILGFAAVTAFTLSACTRAEAEPKPDPAAVEALVDGFEAKPPPPAAAEKAQEKLAKVDRIVAAVDRSEPERLAGAAERMLAR